MYVDMEITCTRDWSEAQELHFKPFYYHRKITSNGRITVYSDRVFCIDHNQFSVLIKRWNELFPIKPGATVCYQYEECTEAQWEVNKGIYQ